MHRRALAFSLHSPVIARSQATRQSLKFAALLRRYAPRNDKPVPLFTLQISQHQSRCNPLDPRPPACEKAAEIRGTYVPLPKTPNAKPITSRTLTEGQRVYETKRAAKAGMSLEKWLASKQRQQEAEAQAKAKAVEAAKPPKPPGLFARLLDRAHRPLGS